MNKKFKPTDGVAYRALTEKYEGLRMKKRADPDKLLTKMEDLVERINEVKIDGERFRSLTCSPAL